jgi:putative tryptophan/tyrosine transport system substrate-binding protein
LISLRVSAPIPLGIIILLLAALAAPLTAIGQRTYRPTRVGVLGSDEPRFNDIVTGLRQGLRDQRHAEEAVEILEARVRRGDRGASRTMVQHLLDQRVDVILAVGSVLAQAVREVSRDVPVVFLTPGDPVATGLVASLAQPGRGMTGMTFEYPELSAKRLELLREMVPRIRSVLVLYDPDDASPRQSLAAARQAAESLGVRLVEHMVRSEEDVARALKDLKSSDALLGVPGGRSSAYYEEMIRAAHAVRRPTMFHTRSDATREALASYGGSEAGIARQAARLVDKILKGARAGELAVERPTRIDLVVNLRTAKALGLTIPPVLLLRADQVIE